MPEARDFHVYHMLFKIISTIVDYPEEVRITTTMINEGREFFIAANSNDVPKIIGSQGRTVKSLRTIMLGISRKQGRSLVITVKDERV